MAKKATRATQSGNAARAKTGATKTSRNSTRSKTLPGQAPKPAEDLGDEAPPVKQGPRMKVRATQLGYYDHTRRYPGDVFTINATRGARTKKVTNKVTGEVEDKVTAKNVVLAFSDKWMEEVPVHTKLRQTTPNDAIRQSHDTVIQLRHGGATTSRASDHDVTGEEED